MTERMDSGTTRTAQYECGEIKPKASLRDSDLIEMEAGLPQSQLEEVFKDDQLADISEIHGTCSRMDISTAQNMSEHDIFGQVI